MMNNVNKTKLQINKSKYSISTPPNTPIASFSESYSSLLSHNHKNNPHGKFGESTYSVEHSMKCNQYKPITKLSATLQGSIWKVSKGENTYIIKVTNKLLHNQHITHWNGKQIHISEDIIKETAIVKYLSDKNPPKSLTKYIDFFADEFNYFFVMEHAGPMSLFQFVKTCHEYINQKLLSIQEWHSFCKIALKQIINIIDWLHSHNTCHLDISLENFCISEVMVITNKATNTMTFVQDFQIRIIDFGVSEVFYSKNKYNEINFECNKYVGKTIYKAPEVYERKTIFDARSADTWSLSVLIFIMIVGCPPWEKPSKSDCTFGFIMNGHLNELLIAWNKFDHVTPCILHLFSLLFQEQKYRLTITEMKRHPFLL